MSLFLTLISITTVLVRVQSPNKASPRLCDFPLALGPTRNVGNFVGGSSVLHYETVEAAAVGRKYP